MEQSLVSFLFVDDFLFHQHVKDGLRCDACCLVAPHHSFELTHLGDLPELSWRASNGLIKAGIADPCGNYYFHSASQSIELS